MRIERADGSVFDTDQERDKRGRFKKIEATGEKFPMTAEGERILGELRESFDGFDAEFKRMFPDQ